jgi:hypothetical protein
LAFKEIEFPRTHDLDALYNLCLPIHSEFKRYENLGELFNEFAVIVRYEEGIEIDLESIEMWEKIRKEHGKMNRVNFPVMDINGKIFIRPDFEKVKSLLPVESDFPKNEIPQKEENKN